MRVCCSVPKLTGEGKWKAVLHCTNKPAADHTYLVGGSQLAKRGIFCRVDLEHCAHTWTGHHCESAVLSVCGYDLTHWHPVHPAVTQSPSMLGTAQYMHLKLWPRLGPNFLCCKYCKHIAH